MAALSKETRSQCSTILGACDEFDTLKALQTLFDVSELAPFRDGLPQTDSFKGRIEQTITNLIPRRLDDGRSVFVIFLETLRDRYHLPDQRNVQLEQLRVTVEQELAIQIPLGEGDQPTAYVLVPQRMSQRPKEGITRLILEAAKEADYLPTVDGPRGAGNIGQIVLSDVVIAYVLNADSELLISVAFALAYARHILLLAHETEHYQLPALLNGVPPILYPSDPGYEEEFKLRIVDALQEIRRGRSELNLFQKAIPAAHPLQAALSDPTRLHRFSDDTSGLLSELRESREQQAVLHQQLEQLLPQLINLAPPRNVDTTTLQQVNELRENLKDMIARHDEAQKKASYAEAYLARLARDRDAIIREMGTVARAIESDQVLLTSQVDSAPQIFVPAALIVPGPPRLSEEERRRDERFVRAFYMDVTPVTNAQFLRFVEAKEYQTVYERQNADQGRDDPTWRTPGGPGSSIDDRMDHPVVWVYREDALAYARWAGRRLPTRLEWERAMRGVDGQAWPWGEQFDPARCNLASNGTTPVGAYPEGVSPAGCLDMVGNAWEWLADDLPGGRLALMGGSWEERGLKVGYKLRVAPGDGTDGATGFRCAIDVLIADNR